VAASRTASAIGQKARNNRGGVNEGGVARNISAAASMAKKQTALGGEAEKSGKRQRCSEKQRQSKLQK